jgi:hypothetical protein
VDIVGDTAYVATSQGLVLIDIADPSNPSMLGMLADINAQDVRVSGDLAYVADAIGLQIVAVTDPTRRWWWRPIRSKASSAGFRGSISLPTWRSWRSGLAGSSPST